MKKSSLRGFTLIELLVVIAIISLLISVLLPALNAARQEGLKTKCLSNLRSIAQGSQTYSMDDASTKLIPETYWSTGDEMSTVTFEGAYDFGGTDGLGGTQWAADAPLGGGFANIGAAIGRPLNRFLMGDNMKDNSGTQNANDEDSFKLYRCPSDSGLPMTPEYAGLYPAEFENPSFTVKGTSYRANDARATGGANGLSSIAPYLRPVNRIPQTSDVIAYQEDIAFITPFNSPSYGAAMPIDIVGWHRKVGKMNIALCDGSARTENMRADDWYPENAPGPNNEQLYTRGRPGYRWDCLPDAPIRDE